MVPEDRITQIRQEVELELLSKRRSHSHIIANNPQSSLHTSLDNTEQQNTNTQNDSNIHPLTSLDNILSHSQPTLTHTFSQQTCTHTADNNACQIDTAFQEKNKDQFRVTEDQFRDTEPISRPYIPKQKPSKRLAMIITHINRHVLPEYLTTEQDFLTQQTLLYSAAYTAAICNGSKIQNSGGINKGRKDYKPNWQIRLEKRVQNLRSDIGRLTDYIRGNRNRTIVAAVEKVKTRYQSHAQHENPNTQLNHYLDTLKQKLNVVSSRLKRYLTCTTRKQQNATFNNSEKSFYRNLTCTNTGSQNQTRPTPETLRDFWASIWENPVEHNKNAEWYTRMAEANVTPDMEFDNITIDTFLQVLERTHNWKTPGSDNLHNYWYKKFTVTHTHILRHFNYFIKSPYTMPAYITQGVTYMLPKDTTDMQNPAKYRPITCLQTIYKILTACISKNIYTHLDKNNILAEQQKGCRKNCQGCKEQLTIDAVVMNNTARKKSNIYTMFIDYRKAFDSVPHSWLLQVLYYYRIHPTIITFLQVSMQNWQTRLRINQGADSISTDPIRIETGIFQGDALSPLWFCLALNPLSELLNKSNEGYKLDNDRTQDTLSHLLYMDDIKLNSNSKEGVFELADITQVFSTDINMELGVDKCKILSVNKGKIQNIDYILRSGESIEAIDEHSVYKYLGFNQSLQIKQKETKAELLKKFKHRLNLILKTHLNSKNIVKAINTYAVPVLTY